MWWVIGETNGDITFNCEGGDGTEASYTRNFYRNGASSTQVGPDAKYENSMKNFVVWTNSFLLWYSGTL